MKDLLSAVIINAKSLIISYLLIGFGLHCSYAQKVNPDFDLLNVGTGKMINLSKTEAKNLVLISYAGNCPFAVGYETRITALIKEFSSNQLQFILINPNVNLALKAETKEEMKSLYDSKKWSIPYMADENQQLTKMLGFAKIPEAIIVKVTKDGMEIVYKGAIDNNPQSAQHANQQFLREALLSITQQKPIKKEAPISGGCVIRKF